MSFQPAQARVARGAASIAALAAVTGLFAFATATPADAHTRVVKRTGQAVNQTYRIGDRNHTGCVYRYQFGWYGVAYAKAKRMPRSRPRCLGPRQGTHICVVFARNGQVTGSCDLRGLGNGWWQAEAPRGWDIVGIDLYANARQSPHNLHLQATWLL